LRAHKQDHHLFSYGKQSLDGLLFPQRAFFLAYLSGRPIALLFDLPAFGITSFSRHWAIRPDTFFATSILFQLPLVSLPAFPTCPSMSKFVPPIRLFPLLPIYLKHVPSVPPLATTIYCSSRSHLSFYIP